MKVYHEALIIFVIAAICGSIAFIAHPKAPSFRAGGLEREIDEISRLQSVFWVDARTDEEFYDGHLDGAVLLNEERWEELLIEFLDAWPPESTVVVYCSSQTCLRSHSVAERLREELGAEEVYVLKGGWERLVEAGKTSEGGSE